MYVKRILWAISFLITLLLSAILVRHLIVAYRTYSPNLDQLVDHEAVEKFLNNFWEKAGIAKERQPIYIPTGLFIDTIKWIDAQSFYVSGYVWQKYTKEARELVSEGFVIPDAVEFKKDEAYRWRDGSVETIGWFFEGKIDQNFDYSKFPFDHKAARIRLWHQDFLQKALLVPDLASYESTLLTDKYGLDPEIVLGGYQILDTFFLYKRSHYDSDL